MIKRTMLPDHTSFPVNMELWANHMASLGQTHANVGPTLHVYWALILHNFNRTIFASHLVFWACGAELGNSKDKRI